MRLERAGALLIDNQMINNLHHLGLAMSGLSRGFGGDHRSDENNLITCFYCKFNKQKIIPIHNSIHKQFM